MLAIEARLQRLAGGVAAREARRVVAELQRLPAAIELDHRGEDRAGPGRQRLQLRQDRVRFGASALAVRDRVDPLPREPRHAAILVLGGVGELAQSLGRVHALGGRHARFRMLRGERELDQRAFVADRGDRAAAALRLRRAARDVGADRVGARVGRLRNAVARAASSVCASAAPSAAASANRTAGSVSLSQAAASAPRPAQRLAAAMRTSGAGSPASSAASSSESGGSSATPATRRAGSASDAARSETGVW